LQDSSSKGNSAEIQALTKPARAATFARLSAGLTRTNKGLVVTGLPQLFAIIFRTQFLYQNSPKLPGACTFSVARSGQWRYNVLLGNDLGFPSFWHSTCYIQGKR
jgi:hypothetical protein